MHHLEPYYNWRALYRAEDDEQSPFYQRQYSETQFQHAIYNYVIHPQWDSIGSPTLYVKLLYTDYDLNFAILELLGEWNDCIHNDVMYLKRQVAEPLMDEGIDKFILIGENILQFHADADDYYEEWFEEVGDGWIVALNFRPHVLEQMGQYRLDFYMNYGGELDDLAWRRMNPLQLFRKVEHHLHRRLP
ncbi:MAG: hypothetical protein HYZ16_05250 [Bacteroidetes bacterium]|jgi:hypothetical protein|nr:hypothetical protein [Bacteroidota bacterium]